MSFVRNKAGLYVPDRQIALPGSSLFLSPTVQYVNYGNFVAVSDLIVVNDYATNLSAVPSGTGVGDDTFTPPSAAAGDALIWIGVGRVTTGSPPATGTGGQTWTELQNTSANPRQLNVNHAVFDGTWVGDLAGANAVNPGLNVVIVLRAFAGTTWNFETLTGPTGIAASSTRTIAGGTPSGAPAMLLGMVQSADDLTYAFTGGSFAMLDHAEGFRNPTNTGNSLAVVLQYQATVAASGNATLSVSSSFAYTRTLISAYRS